MLSYPLLFTYVIALNTRRPPFDALTAAGAWTRRWTGARSWRAISTVWNAVALAGATDIPGYVPVADSGTRAVAAGPPFRFELLTVGSGEAPLEQMIQARLRGAGMDARIRQLELSAFLARVYGPAHDFDAAVLGVTGDAGLAYLGPLAAVAGLAAPTDPARAQRMFADSLPAVVLYHARGLQG